MQKETIFIDLSKYKKPLSSIVEDFLSNNFEEGVAFTKKRTKTQTEKSFSLGEGTKTYDGMEIAKQVTEFLIYSFFQTKRIRKATQIKPVLYEKFGPIDKKVKIRIIELLKDAYKRLYEWQPSIQSTSKGIQLFRNTEGNYGFVFKKTNMSSLKICIKLCKLAFVKNKKNKNKQ